MLHIVILTVVIRTAIMYVAVLIVLCCRKKKKIKNHDYTYLASTILITNMVILAIEYGEPLFWRRMGLAVGFLIVQLGLLFLLWEGRGAAKGVRKKECPARSQLDQFRFAMLPLPLIMEGKVQDDNLVSINKTRFWLKNQLQLKGVNHFKQVFFCSIDYKGELFIDRI